MKTPRIIAVYSKNLTHKTVNEINEVIESIDNFKNLSICTRISHVLSGNIVQEEIDRNSIITVKRNNNFFINLN